MKGFSWQVVSNDVAEIGLPDNIQGSEHVRVVVELQSFDLVLEKIASDFVIHIPHIDGFDGNLLSRSCVLA